MLGGSVHTRILATLCMVLGIGLAATWWVFISPALFIAEAGARPNLWERLLVASPLLISGGMLLLAGRLARRAARHTPWWSVLSTSTFVCAALAGVAVIWVLTREW
jgi:hypothetical protein